MISVYPSTEKLFKDNGIKVLKPIKALIRKEDNGDYYLDIKDKIDCLEYYQAGMIIRTLTPWGYQAFRLTNPDIDNNKVSARAYHVYFDSENYIIKDSFVVDKNCNDALDHLNNSCDNPTPFTTISDVSNISSYRCVRKSLEEAIATVIDRWGGHLDRDNFNIAIRSKIGQDRGIVLSYAKNIKNIKQKENWDNVVTKILPVGKDGILLPETYLEVSEELYDIPHTKVVSFDQNDIVEDDYKDDGVLDEERYKEALIKDLRYKATTHLENNKFPKVNYSVDAYIEKVSDVGDVIYVKHPKCKIDLTTNVIAIEYDCIAEKYTKIEFGNFKSKLKNLIDTVTSSITNEVNKSKQETVIKLETDLKEATKIIKNSMSESYCIYDGDKILVVDKLPKEQATNVLMISNGGIGFSQTGINGTFNSAWSIDGTLNMQKINVINLVADMIKGGTLKLGSNLNEAGVMELYDEANKLICLIDKTGLTFFNEDNSYIKINPDVGFAGFDADGNKTYWVDGDEFHQKKSVVEEEITIASKLRMIPIETDTNNGVGFVSVVQGG